MRSESWPQHERGTDHRPVIAIVVRLGSLVVSALDSRVRFTAAATNTGMGGQTTSVLHQAIQANSASHRQGLSETDNAYQPKCGMTLCGWGVQVDNGSFHLWINVWVSGNTLWSLVNTSTEFTCHPHVCNLVAASLTTQISPIVSTTLLQCCSVRRHLREQARS